MENNHEIEAKFYVNDLAAVEKQLISMGAKQFQPRTHEFNLRFDTQDLSLSKSGSALRLRQDTEARFTFKGPSQSQDGVLDRQEIEFIVGDFKNAWAFMKALGYKLLLIYEKYRTTYELNEVHITLDELPYGNCVEIEGPDISSIKDVNLQLGLDWGARIYDSYTVLFDKLRIECELEFRDLIFENFERLDYSLTDINMKPADSK